MDSEQHMVSVITIVFNNRDRIESSITSVLKQTCKNIEYLIIDGGSTDGTVDIIKKYQDKISYWVSEPDKGIYDGMNKGIAAAKGDIIGFLNSDDVYADDEVIGTVIETIAKETVDSCYGDLTYVGKDGHVVRKWKSGDFSRNRFKKGWMPPHPTFFVKREMYQQYGGFNTNFLIAADYELMLRMLYRFGISTTYIPKVLVNMRTGGKSNKSLSNIVKANIECYHAWKVNGLNPNPGTFVLKPLSKIFQYLK